MLSRIITRNETWVSHINPGIKVSVDGMATDILSRQGQSQKNAVNALDYGNSVLGPAWCFAGGLYAAKEITINSGDYCATLRKLRRVLQSKRRDMLSKGVLLLHDNARPHTSGINREFIESFG
ncbi:hypothetical protein TNCV_1594021 [Trichonephila clavipes]|nr:hypothetical protein TNCV_1594021 [Trichonephila clavipes]